MMFMKILKNTVQKKECKILIEFDDMIADMVINKKPDPTVTELFIKGRKLNISLIFIIQSYFTVPKSSRLNSIIYFIMKIPNRWELQKMAFNHSLDIDFKDFMKLSKNALQNHILF